MGGREETRAGCSGRATCLLSESGVEGTVGESLCRVEPAGLCRTGPNLRKELPNSGGVFCGDYLSSFAAGGVD